MNLKIEVVLAFLTRMTTTPRQQRPTRGGRGWAMAIAFGSVLASWLARDVAYAQSVQDAGVFVGDAVPCDAGPCDELPAQPAPSQGVAEDTPPGGADVPAGEAPPQGKQMPASTEQVPPKNLPAGDAPPPVEPVSGDERDDQAVVSGEVIEMVDEAPLTEAEKLVQSSRAITVIETERARRQSSDMGDLVGAAQGINIRRSGGLGAGMRLSLNGLTGEQVRFFLDGIPLDLAGFPAGLTNVPVNLVDRVEIYRGVVPIQFGADALGGAVNLVTEPNYYATRASASYQLGSFGTHRATLGGRWRPAGSSLLVGLHAFADSTDNDYRVDVDVPDEQGRVQRARVPRFHDGYGAWGVGLEVGRTLDSADRLLLRAFVSVYDKELQHNPVMTIPYGEVTFGETIIGATGRWDDRDWLGSNLDLSLLASGVRRTIRFRDDADVVYDWFGQPVRERIQPGEIDPDADDQEIWQNSVLARLLLTWRMRPAQAIRVSVAPTFTTRTGDNRIQSSTEQRDPLTAQRDLFSTVGGLEHELRVGERVENTAFAKAYLLLSRSEEVDPEGNFRELDRTITRMGFGDGARIRLNEPLALKASYEYSTRFPGVDEIFGNGVLIVPNLELEPETSHNVNLALQLTTEGPGLGALQAELNGFARLADELIVLVGNERFFHYENIYSARILGIESSASWRPGCLCFGLDASFTVEDARNASSAGAFMAYRGDRIPNRPWLFGTMSAYVQRQSLLRRGDSAALSWSTHYAHEFFRGWESQGLLDYKQVIPAQFVQTAGLSYATKDIASLTIALDAHNVTNRRVYDFYGVQRPGRAFFLKLTAEY
jgi:vitamin B12 transporter